MAVLQYLLKDHNAENNAVKYRTLLLILSHFLWRACAVRCCLFQSVPYVVSVVFFLQYGRTPLLWAARKGHSEVVSLLLERGADKEARDTSEVSTPFC